MQRVEPLITFFIDSLICQIQRTGSARTGPSFKVNYVKCAVHKKMQIKRSVFYRAQHVTGPACVLVSLKFGKTPAGGPLVISILTPKMVDPMPKFDVENHIAEVLAGVARVNSEFGGSLEVEAVELVPDGYPMKFQAQHVVYTIARAVLNDQV